MPGARAAARASAGSRGVAASQLTFPLVPRWRPAGSPFGRLRASRRGLGSSVAGSRPYRRGDSLAAIDWKSSARLSSVRSEPEFLVREHFADESPRVVMVADRRPSMGLYPEPWLSKPATLQTLWQLVSAAALAELGLAGFLDATEWIAPSSRAGLEHVERDLVEAPFDAPEGSLDDAFDRLATVRRSLSAGTFVFVCSDFLAPPSSAWWARAHAFRWDVVPVVIQDPVWEQSFPPIERLVVPFADPATGRTHRIRLGRVEAALRRRANESRLALIVSDLRAFGLEPIVVSNSTESDVLAALTAWGETRLAVRRGEW
ncbi:MAG TPA: DUF58 domain-containing protein [Gaiellaceae bacterium]|nr:DUF58 domain-containing protein [Gaiellaceae bacterium]